MRCYMEVRRWDTRGMLVLAIVAIVASLGIPLGLKLAAPSPVLRVIFGVLILAFCFGPAVWFAVAGAEMRKRLNLRCPHCGALFNQVAMKHALESGKCKRCEKMVFEADEKQCHTSAA